MFRVAVLLCVLHLFLPTMLLADCKATLFADDWSGDLQSVNAVNEFCSKRASWWRIDSTKYQQKDYCFTNKETRTDSYGRQYYVYPTSFWFQLKSFNAYTADDLLMSIHTYSRDFSFQGWPASVRIIFEPKCT